jgi:zinc protease
MNTHRVRAAVLILCLLASGAFAQTGKTAPAKPSVAEIDIPYTKHVLSNGLTLLVHEDHKAPIVAVNVWYHVGSKNEPNGRSGFAHLFEHLMFNGSENFDQDYFQALERVGATDLNGTTNEDRTNYFQNVPTSALDMVLWLESDRMGHLLGAIDQALLDEQRGVVQNEKRQYENEPYSISYDLITDAVFSNDHPYGHTVIGSMDDLNAAKLEDVKDWFSKYYGAANAVLVLAGDITPEVAKQKVEKYFGDIPSGPPVHRYESWPAKREGVQRQRTEDRVAQARLYKVWNVPGTGSADAEYLNMLADVLVGDKASRLYKRMVYDEQIATNVSAYVDAREIASLFQVELTAKPGDDLSKVEKAFDEELKRVLEKGVAADELERVKTQYLAGFVRGIERIGGFGGKSDILAQSLVYRGSPDAYKATIKRVSEATVADVNAAAKRWLSEGVYTLEVVPFPKYQPAAGLSETERKTMPQVGEMKDPRFPDVKRTRLSNGMNVVLAERKSVPTVSFNLLFDAGYAADQFAAPGTASLTMNMLDEGTKTRNAIDISKELASLGATLGSGSSLDTSTVALSTLKSTLDRALELYADVLLNPSFPQSDFDRLKKLQIAAIQREKQQPIQMALRVFPSLLYGKGHAYSIPFTGSGTEDAVAKLTRDDLIRFHQTWLKPNNATLVIVGDTTLDEIKPKLEARLASWKGGDTPKKNLGDVAAAPKSTIYIIDKPGAVQSFILAGVIAPPKSNPDEIAIETMNTILGGAFISRLNMNLREDKHWAYGAGSFIPNARGPRVFVAYAPVQTDKTKESVQEVLKELRGITKDRVVTADELVMAKGNLTLALPGQWETNGAIGGSIAEMVQYGLPNDYFDTYAGRVRAMTLNDMNRAATTVVKPENLTWVIVGDRSKIEQGIRELKLGEVQFLDVDGKIVK